MAAAAPISRANMLEPMALALASLWLAVATAPDEVVLLPEVTVPVEVVRVVLVVTELPLEPEPEPEPEPELEPELEPEVDDAAPALVEAAPLPAAGRVRVAPEALPMMLNCSVRARIP